jgi:hypothetical protein
VKKLLPLIIILGFTFTVQPAQALGCAQVKTMIKSLGASVDFSNVKGAQSMVTAYKTAFDNPKCLPPKDLREMKQVTKELIIECAKPDTVYKSIMSKPIFTAFCGGFKKLEKYTK